MMLKQGDILLVPFPFTDLTSNKRRPALILSNDAYNSVTDDVIVAAITSNITSDVAKMSHGVVITNKDMIDGELRMDSCIRADRIYTLSKMLAVKRFGSVNDKIVELVIEGFLEITKQNC